MFKVLLMGFIVASLVGSSAFAEATIEVGVSSENIKSLDSVFVIGKISGVSDFKPVKVTVMGPDGSIVYAPTVSIGEGGEFRKLLHPTIPSFKAGTYTVTASHPDTQVTAKTQFTVASEAIPRNPNAPQSTEEIVAGEIVREPAAIQTGGITLTADAIIGSDVIKITGKTIIRGTDVTLIVNSPAGNIVTIAQVTPDLQGNFNVDVKVGGPMWKEDGLYKITANQGESAQHKESIQVEIKDGLVVPEFGTIASLILVISVIAIIMVSSKSKLSILQRY